MIIHDDYPYRSAKAERYAKSVFNHAVDHVIRAMEQGKTEERSRYVIELCNEISELIDQYLWSAD